MAAGADQRHQHPVAVNPDFRLKQTALQHDWAILNLK
jgi:hypothetical protein